MSLWQSLSIEAFAVAVYYCVKVLGADAR